MKTTPEKLTLSVVVPLFDEAQNVVPLVEAIEAALERSGRRAEILLIDDGSTDGTAEKVREAARENPRIRGVVFRRNFGQTAAMSAGFDRARGDVVVAIDGDLQNDPEDMEMLVREIEEGGFDIASGWRKSRKDALLSRKVPSWIANWMIGRITGVRLHDYGCSLKAYRAEVLRNVRLYGEMHRFIPALASWSGARITEIPVSHRARERGASKYGISRTLRVVLDLVTVKFLLAFSTRPLQVFGVGGFFMLTAGSLISLYLGFLRIFRGVPLADRPLLLLGVLLILAGVQLVSMGLLAEITIRTYHESQSKPTYVVRETLGSDEGDLS